MRVAILQCDEVLEHLQPRFGRYPAMIRQMFAAIDAPFNFETFDCRKEEYPEDISGYDFFITTGSRTSAYDKEQWIQTLIEFVKELDKRKKKLIGICYGHQIIAMAYGKNVEKSGKGWGIGVSTNRIVSKPQWLKQPLDQLNVIASHQDQVTSITERAVIIAESDFCPYFMVQWNDYFLSIQGHPEWNREYSRALIKHRRGIIPAPRINEGLDSLQLAPDNELVVQWIVDFVMKTKDAPSIAQ